jgi:hypothetical protein
MIYSFKSSDAAVIAWKNIQVEQLHRMIEKAVTFKGDTLEFSSAKWNKAIEDFGKDKMNVLYQPEQLLEIKKIGNIMEIIGGGKYNFKGNPSNGLYKAVQSLMGFLPGASLGKNVFGTVSAAAGLGSVFGPATSIVGAAFSILEMAKQASRANIGFRNIVDNTAASNLRAPVRFKSGVTPAMAAESKAAFDSAIKSMLDYYKLNKYIIPALIIENQNRKENNNGK